MKFPPYQEAVDAFANLRQDFSIAPVTGGLINHSFRITNKLNGKSYLLQQINLDVFPNPSSLQLNYEILWDYLRTEAIPFKIPAPENFPGETTIFIDSHKRAWRVFEYIDGEHLKTPTDPMQAGKVARCFASFTASFSGLNAELLRITIPKFHDLSERYRQFEKALKGGNFERLLNAAREIADLKKRARYADLYEVMTESDEFKLRVMHHDAKIGNVLFDKKTGAVICPVDLDTVMPGYYFSDLGDLIRSMICAKDETSIDFPSICVREDYYRAIVEGYLAVMEIDLTEAEKKYVHYAGPMMIYMQALRFLTDYLNGDTYYKVDYKEQNIDRARNQVRLLTQLESFLRTNYSFGLDFSRSPTH